MISHTSSISSLGNSKLNFKEKDYEMLHYFDDQSDNEIEQDKSKNKFMKENTNNFMDYNLDSSFEAQSKDDNEEFYFMDCEPVCESNQKVIEMSPDGNFGKVSIT